MPALASFLGRAFWSSEERARRLLHSWLSPDQRKQFVACGCFDVVGSDSGKRYRICEGLAFNVQELDNLGSVVRVWCFTVENVATSDVYLAQKIALETFENEALAVANRRSAPAFTTPAQRS